MAHVIGDRVLETSVTTGTGNLALAGAVAGFRAFSAVAVNNDTIYYAVEHQTLSEWEVGLGTWLTGSNLARTTILASSNAGAAVNFSAGTKNVFATLPASRTGVLQPDLSTLYPIVGSIPAPPPADNLKFYARNRGGRILAEMVGPSGIDTSLQPALFGNNIVLWLPGVGTTAAIAFGTSWTVAATQSHPAIATGALITSMRRAQYATSATAGNASGVRSAAVTNYRGETIGGVALGGFYFAARFGVVTFQSACQIWVGLSQVATLLAGDPSAQNNTVCIGKDQADTNWQLIFRGTVATKVDLGLAVAANQVLDVFMFVPPGSGNITFRVVRLDVPTVLADNTVHSTNLPTATALLVPHAEIRTNAASSVVLALNKIYIESDF